MQPGEAAVRLRVQVAPEDAQAHCGVVTGLVGVPLGVLVSGLGVGGSSVAARTRPLQVDLRQRPRSPSRRLGDEAEEAG